MEVSMAIHDPDHRSARDYMHDARSRYDDASTGTKWAGIIVGLALLAFVIYMLFATAGPDTAGDSAQQMPTTTTAPTTAPTTQPR
jgi:hypothetical protein